MNISVSVSHKGVFRKITFTNETKQNATKKDFFDALRAFEKSSLNSLRIDGVDIVWNTKAKFHLGIVTIAWWQIDDTYIGYDIPFEAFKRKYLAKF